MWSRTHAQEQPQGFQDDEQTADVCTAQLELVRALLRFCTDADTMDFFVAHARGE
jgi:hypothetical protein